MITTASVVPYLSCDRRMTLRRQCPSCADSSAARVRLAQNLSAPGLLALREEVVPAVLRPAALVVLSAHRPFLAVGDHGDAIRSDALGLQVAHGRLGTALAEGQVVLVGATLVAVAVDPNELVRIRLEPVHVGIERLRITRTNPVRVEGEVHRLQGRVRLVVRGRSGSRGGRGGQGGGGGGRGRGGGRRGRGSGGGRGRGRHLSHRRTLWTARQ